MRKIRRKRDLNKISNHSIYKEAMSIYFNTISKLLIFVFAVIGVMYVSLTIFVCIIFE